MYNKIILEDGEQIKDIQGYEGLYAITTHGRVWSYRKKTNSAGFLKPDIRRGYPSVRLGKFGKKISIHRLVCKAFIENALSKPQVNHKDGVKTNNHIDNLEWCTQSENLLHAVKIGLKPRTTARHQEALKKAHTGRVASEKQVKNMQAIGEKYYKITIDTASEICEAYATGLFTYREISKEIGISISRVSQIINNKWSMTNV